VAIITFRIAHTRGGLLDGPGWDGMRNAVRRLVKRFRAAVCSVAGRPNASIDAVSANAAGGYHLRRPPRESLDGGRTRRPNPSASLFCRKPALCRSRNDSIRPEAHYGASISGSCQDGRVAIFDRLCFNLVLDTKGADGLVACRPP